MSNAGVVCSACCADLVAVQPGAPCPSCGVTARTYLEDLLAKQETRVSVLRRTFRAGIRKGRAAIEGKFGASRTVRTGKWNWREYTADRENDRYDEVVLDAENGQVIYEHHGRLSEHQGRGSATRSSDAAPITHQRHRPRVAGARGA